MSKVIFVVDPAVKTHDSPSLLDLCMEKIIFTQNIISRTDFAKTMKFLSGSKYVPQLKKPPHGIVERTKFIGTMIYELSKFPHCTIKGGAALSILSKTRVRDLDLTIHRNEFDDTETPIFNDIMTIISNIEDEDCQQIYLTKESGDKETVSLYPRFEVFATTHTAGYQAVTWKVVCFLDTIDSKRFNDKWHKVLAEVGFDTLYAERNYWCESLEKRQQLFSVDIDLCDTKIIPDFMVNLFTVKTFSQYLYNSSDVFIGYLDGYGATLQDAMDDFRRKIARPYVYEDCIGGTFYPTKHCHLLLSRFERRINKMIDKGYTIYRTGSCDCTFSASSRDSIIRFLHICNDCYFTKDEPIQIYKEKKGSETIWKSSFIGNRKHTESNKVETRISLDMFIITIFSFLLGLLYVNVK